MIRRAPDPDCPKCSGLGSDYSSWLPHHGALNRGKSISLKLKANDPPVVMARFTAIQCPLARSLSRDR